MSGGPSQTQTTQQTSSTGAWQPSQDALKGVLGQAQGLLGSTGLSGAESNAVGGLLGNANTAQNYSSQLQGIADSALAGGGYGQGMGAMQDAWGTAQSALNPIATGSLDPNQNPMMQQMIQQITDQAQNSVGAQFAGAGRSFSGAHAGATGKAITEGLAPTLFNQYNQNAQNAMNASGQLLSGSQGFSSGMDSSAGNMFNAQMQAPTALSNMNTPQMMALQAEAQRRGIPLQNLSDINSLILPIAQTGSQGTQSGTQQQQTKSDPWQTAAGGGLGILGILGQAGILSDVRAKENARPIGATFDGQTIYAFNYKGDPRTTIGLMAQEVAEKYPEAVKQRDDGMLLVDYAVATANSVRGDI